MMLYKYTVSKIEDQYRFDIGEVDTDLSPEAADLALHFQFDQPIRIDFPDTNQISYLFNDKLALMSFCEGLRFSTGMVEYFDNMKKTLEDAIAAGATETPEGLTQALKTISNLNERLDDEQK